MSITNTEPAIARYTYLPVMLLAVLQAWLIKEFPAYLYDQPFAGLYLTPLSCALIIPSAFSFLVSDLKRPVFYLNIFIVIACVLWVSLWFDSNVADVNYKHEESIFISIVLVFIILPWLQLRQMTGKWSTNYSCLIGLYGLNTLFAVFAAAIGGAVVLLSVLATYLFDLVQMNSLAYIMSRELFRWVLFCLAFNICLLFLRRFSDIQATRIFSLIARFFLPILNFVGMLFLVGMLFSLINSISSDMLDSSVRVASSRVLSSPPILIFLIISIILINIVYGDGKQGFKFRPWLNGFVLINIGFLSIFALFTLYGILARVNQYGWSYPRLYAFFIIMLIGLTAISYSISVILKRNNWSLCLGAINKTILLLLVISILATSSPAVDFYKIATNNLLERINADDDPIIKYQFVKLGKTGEEAWENLLKDEKYKARTDNSYYKNNSDELDKLLSDVMLISTGSDPLPESWWKFINADGNKYKYLDCTKNYSPYNCLGFTKDINNDGENEVVICSGHEQARVISCTVWQQKSSDIWIDTDEQMFNYSTPAQRKAAWGELLKGNIEIKPKEWQQIVIKADDSSLN